MSLWSRLTHAVRSFVERITGAEPEDHAAPYEPDYRDYGRDYDRGERDADTREGASQLPDGWVLVGLYHQGEKTTKIHATDDTDVTDNDIENADALIVWYEDAGEDGYRWVHGATGWDSLADQVERVIVIVSPTGRGE